MQEFLGELSEEFADNQVDVFGLLCTELSKELVYMEVYGNDSISMINKKFIGSCIKVIIMC